MTSDTRHPPVRADVLRRGFGVLWVAVREEPRVFAISVIGSAVFGLMTVGGAWVIRWVTGRLIVPALDAGHTTSAALAGGALAILGVTLAKVLGIFGRRLGAGSMQYRMQARYRRRVTRRYLELPLEWHQRHPTGGLLSNANADVEAAWFPIAPFPFAVGTVIMIVGAFGFLFATDWVLALIGVAVFPAVFGVNVAYSRRMSPRMTRAQRLRAEVSALALESFDGALVVKTLGREASETERFGARARELRDALVDVGRVRGLFDPAMEALPQLGTLAVLVVGALRLRAGQATVGDVVSVAYLFTVLAFPIRAIGWVLGELPRSVVGWDRIQHVLTATGSMECGASEVPSSSGPASVALDGVAFSYGEGADDRVEVLHDVTFTVPAGRTVALVGPTGAGKSTITTLVARLVDPAVGAVRIDGADVRSLRPGAVSEVVALVPQTTFVFDDTVRGNITLGEEVDDDTVWVALRAAQAERFVRALPSGLDTRVGERGTSLSGGQRQRLALARALIRRPRLLVLDDATSAVDPSVEQAILAGLRAGAGETTVLVVAYRRATIAMADEVVYIEQGRVVAHGAHRDLMARIPGYVDLVTAYEEAERARERSTDEVSA